MAACGIVREALRRFPAETVRNAELMVAELVTNVLVHARTALQLEIDVDVPCVRITIEDSSSAEPRMPRPEANEGLGLAIVELLSTAWGWEPTPFGKRVWFELDGIRSPDSGGVPRA